MNDLDGLEGEDLAYPEEVNTTSRPYHGQGTDFVNLTTFGDEYDYDIETSINSFFWDELLPTLIVYTLTFILGLVGNILIIFTTFRYRKMKSTTNVFLASLASADLLLIVFCIPVKDVLSEENSLDKESNTCCPNPPGEMSKRLAWSKRDVSEEFVADKKTDGRSADNLDKTEHPKGNSSRTVLMKILQKDDFDTTELEELILKLQKALKDCNEVLAPCSIETEKEKGMIQAEEFSNEAAPCSCTPVIAYPVSTVRSHRSKKWDKGAFYVEKPKNFTFDDDEDDEERMKDVTSKDRVLFGWPNSSTSSSEGPIKEAVSEHKSVKSGKALKTDKPMKSEKSWKSGKSTVTNTSGKSRKSSLKFPHRSFIGFLDEHRETSNSKSSRVVEKRILNLECRLKELLRRIGVYPTKEQDAIKRCLERLKETSEAVLKRLRVNHLDYCKYTPGSQGDRAAEIVQRGYHSEPETTIKMNKDQKSIILKTSGSEIQLNLGMEITMENFDPATGKKLEPELSLDFEQRGNIQCKLVKPGEEPVTFINTDFLYNPKTGMLFNSFRKEKNEDLPLKPTKTYLLSEAIEPAFPANAEPEHSTKKKPKFTEFYKREEDSFEEFRLSSESKYDVREKTTDSSKSEHSDAFRLAVEREEMRNMRYLKEVKKPRYPFEKTPKSAARRDNQKKVSLIPTARFAPKSGQIYDQANVKFIEKSAPEQTFHLKEAPQLAKLFSYTWMFGFFICKLVYYMQSVSAICSVLTLTAMSVERYYAIVHPMRAQYVCTISQARKIITFTWISSLFLAIPVLFAQIHMPVGVRVKGFWCVRDYDSPTIWRAHETYMLLLILIIPTILGYSINACYPLSVWTRHNQLMDLTHRSAFCSNVTGIDSAITEDVVAKNGVMGVAYTTICLEIWQVMQRRQDLTSAKILNTRYNKTSMNSDNFCMYGKEKKKPQRKTFGEHTDDEAHVKQVIKMLVAVVVIYVVCWAPLLIDNLLQAYGVLPFMKFGKQKYIATAFHLMAYFNSCINPIVYGFMSKNFRESFRKALCCSSRRGNFSMRNPSMSNDRSMSIRYAESSFGRTVSVTLPD